MSASDPFDPNFHYLGQWVFGQAGSRVLRSTAGGATVSEIGPPRSGANFVAPLVLHPNTGSPFLLTGADRVYRCNDPRAAFPTWVGLGPADANNPIAAIGISADPLDLWIVRNAKGSVATSSRVFRSLDGGQNWTEEVFDRPARFPTRIVVDPGNAEHVFLTFGGAAADNLWERNPAPPHAWRPITTPLIPARDFELHPTDPSCYLLATQMGLFGSEDSGGSWQLISPLGVSVEETFWSGGHLFLATHGRGLMSQTPFATAAMVDVGQPCQINGGPTPGPLFDTGLPLLGTTVALDVTQATPSTLAVVVLGAPPAVPPSCGWQADNFVILATFTTSSSGTGSASHSLPADPVLAGSILATQAAELPSGGIVRVSQGVHWTLGF
jgi:hypothetical protein